MPEYIERDSFLDSKRHLYCENCARRKNEKGKIVYEIGDAPCRSCGIGDVLDDVEDFPAADVVERKRGEWERKPDPYGFFETIPVCSICGCTTKWRETYIFCPNCGADMRGEDDG